MPDAQPVDLVAIVANAAGSGYALVDRSGYIWYEGGTFVTGITTDTGGFTPYVITSAALAAPGTGLWLQACDGGLAELGTATEMGHPYFGGAGSGGTNGLEQGCTAAEGGAGADPSTPISDEGGSEAYSGQTGSSSATWPVSPKSTGDIERGYFAVGDAEGDAGAGLRQLTILGERQSGAHVQVTQVNPPAEGSGSLRQVPHLTVDAHVGLGRITVTSGQGPGPAVPPGP